MRINGHAHIFNLQTVLTEEAIALILGRLTRQGFPDFVVEGVARVLHDQLARPEYLSEEEILAQLLRAIAGTPSYRNVMSSGTTIPVELRLLGTAFETLGTEYLQRALARLSSWVDTAGVGGTVADIYGTLVIAMRPDIVSVADHLLGQLRPDDAIVALMMDIVGTSEKPRDAANFRAQLAGTAAAALARPGRVLPFVAVNPTRGDHHAVMKRALESSAFLGVKLYPSLGYDVTSAKMGRVLDYCEEHDVPILMHASAGGFFKSPQAAQNSHPKLWKPLLAARPGLRVCFAHCGGWGGFSNQDAAQREWWDAILQLMHDHDEVYGDLAFHVDMMSDPDRERRYLDELRALLGTPRTAERLIFGTDSWMLRMAMTEREYWHYYETLLSAAEFAQIAEAAPRRFLGIPQGTNEAPRANVRRHVDWLVANRDAVGAEPTAWVRALTDATFLPTRVNPAWTRNNRAHVLLYHFLETHMRQVPAAHRGFERVGALRLRQLAYWTKGHEPDAMFAARCTQNAEALDRVLAANGGSYEGSYDEGTAVQKLQAVFADGDRTVPAAAAAVDAIYMFAQEVA